MEAGTRTSTQSRTIADLLPRAARQFGDKVALKHKVDGTWTDVTFAQVGEIVTEIALGLIDLGIAPGERVCILANTRPEWTYADFAVTAAGAAVVPIYPTNSPEECAWVAGNSDAVAVIAEDASQLAKIEAVRADLPALRHLIVIDGPAEGALAVDDLRGRGRGRDRAELEARY
jgi:long-chain acyl-CoA synthetase